MMVSDFSRGLGLRKKLEGSVRDGMQSVASQVDEVMNLALEKGRRRLLRYEELPFSWQGNVHILGGYRFHPVDRWELYRSAFELQNEASLSWPIYTRATTHAFFFLPSRRRSTYNLTCSGSPPSSTSLPTFFPITPPFILPTRSSHYAFWRRRGNVCCALRPGIR
jgi:hypothetical protein